MATATRPTPVSTSRGRYFAALVAGLLIGGVSLAQNPIITATYQEANPKDTFSFTTSKGVAPAADGKLPVNTKNVGTLRWDVPTTQFGTSGLDRAFDTFCAEPLVPVNAGKTYRFEVQSPEVPEAYGLPDTDAGRKEAIRRTQFVRELYGRHYTATQNLNDPIAAPAFQVALWELLQEGGTTPPVVPAAADGVQPAAAAAHQFDLSGGAFRATTPAGAQLAPAAVDGGGGAPPSPAVVQRAGEMLRSLTGNESVFFENPALAGRELVRLKGLANAAGEVGQSQLALRQVVGGVGGAGGAAGGAAGGGGLLAGGGVGGFAPTALGGGGAGGGFGGLGGFGTGSGTPTTTTTVPPVTGTTPPTTVPNTPINPPTSVPPVGGTPPSTTPPNTPDTPGVPAPPALLLAVAGVGLLAGRKLVGKKSAAK